MTKPLDHGVTIDVLGGAVSLPRPRDTELRPWALHEARTRFGKRAKDKQVTALADVLEHAALDTSTRDTTLAFAFCPQPEQGELARIEVSILEPDDKAPELSVAWFAERLGKRVPQSVGPAEITYGDLPIGPAVRVSAQFQPRPDDGEGSTLLQTAAWAAIPPGYHHGVLLYVSWQALAMTDRLNAMVDKLAHSLRTAVREDR